MLIWDYIRDFLVQHIFGGMDSSQNVFRGFLGDIYYYSDEVDESFNIYSNDQFLSIGKNHYGENLSISLGDWLSTTTTIIIMCLFVVCFVLLVRWIFKLVSSAFLLR